MSRLDELAVIERLTRSLSLGRSGLWSVGDDGALLAAQDRLVVTDAMVEGRHFDLRWSSWSDVGFKLLARNVSDIFAMGGRPTAMLLTLALPCNLAAAALDAFAKGLETAAARWGNPVLIGGDTTSVDGPAVLTLTLFGKRGSRLLARSGGRAGDRLWVDGPLGLAAAGLALLASGESHRSEVAVAAHRRPSPKPLLPGAMRAAHACIDISDGLLLDASRLASASGCGLVVTEVLPGREQLQPLARDREELAAWQLTGGDDYVRLVSASASPGRGWSPVGRLTADEGCFIEREDGTLYAAAPSGYLHHFGQP
ncbi:MAG: thiamine-phosphate kinase [Deltaproteobacteria bacterium]|nr:thiamine-phosphate kinase [Deltaproteobacteria bacterium]